MAGWVGMTISLATISSVAWIVACARVADLKKPFPAYEAFFREMTAAFMSVDTFAMIVLRGIHKPSVRLCVERYA
ncbi:protein of unknown function [Pararobbsia alpina]